MNTTDQNKITDSLGNEIKEGDTVVYFYGRSVYNHKGIVTRISGSRVYYGHPVEVGSQSKYMASQPFPKSVKFVKDPQYEIYERGYFQSGCNTVNLTAVGSPEHPNLAHQLHKVVKY